MNGLRKKIYKKTFDLICGRRILSIPLISVSDFFGSAGKSVLLQRGVLLSGYGQGDTIDSRSSKED
jgi:hypothetical protein